MKCAEDITLFNSFIQRQRLYQFLAGINDNLDNEKCDLLHQDPLPTINTAYTTIRREITRCGIMSGDSSLGRSPSKIGSGLSVHPDQKILQSSMKIEVLLSVVTVAAHVISNNDALS